MINERLAGTSSDWTTFTHAVCEEIGKNGVAIVVLRSRSIQYITHDGYGFVAKTGLAWNNDGSCTTYPNKDYDIVEML